MSRGNIYITKYPDNPPEWYWTSGLHDACIVGVEAFEFPFDYNRFSGNKNKYDRNLMSLKINANGAMFDDTVKEIRLINYKVLSDDLGNKGTEEMLSSLCRGYLKDCEKYYERKGFEGRDTTLSLMDPDH